MNIFYIILLMILNLVGIAVIFFGIGGTWIIVGASFLYGLVTGFSDLTLNFCFLLLGLTIGQEILEAVLGGVLAKTFGGSKWAIAGAIIGGTGGAILGTPIAPVIGTLLGGLLGAFGGALLLEWVTSNNLKTAFRAGMGALCGAIGGKVTKILLAIVMTILVAIQIF